MKRIVVTGPRGSGKSTFAYNLSRLTGIPVYSLDTLFLTKTWDKKPGHLCRRILRELVDDKDCWIIEGHTDYKCLWGTYDLRLRRADTAFFLDYSNTICLMRIIKRYALFRGRARPNMPSEFIEKFPPGFWKRVLQYPFVERPLIRSKLHKYSKTLNLHAFKSTQQANIFLETYLELEM